MYLPLLTSRGAVGVLGLIPADQQRLQDPDRMHLLEAFANQAALAIERAALAEEAQQAWERVEAELLRNTLLSSVSHDLRTPLAAITGAATTMLEAGPSLASDTRRELTEAICAESERMERLINNLLDMTRLESGGLKLNKEWQPLQEVIGVALRRLEKQLAGRHVEVDLPSDLPLVHIDAVALEQVVTNLLDNAIQYTPAGSPIEIRARREEDAVRVAVVDHGPGLPPGTEQRVFEKFFRANPKSGRRGIGLGLTICRGIVEAHGGKIVAANRPAGGAEFSFTLPMDEEPPKVDTAEMPNV